MSERISFETEDHAQIIGDYYEGGSDKAAVLLHMMPATRASWVSLANILALEGFSSLAIDLRGHGESLVKDGEPLDYREFQDADHAGSIKDVEASVAFLLGEKKMKKISLVGASIGANLSIAFAAEHPEVASFVLLSPGLIYGGVDAESAAKRCSNNQSGFFVASEEDEYSAASAKELHELFPGKKELRIFKDAGHGTAILERNPEFGKELALWLSKTHSA